MDRRPLDFSHGRCSGRLRGSRDQRRFSHGFHGHGGIERRGFTYRQPQYLGGAVVRVNAHVGGQDTNGDTFRGCHFDAVRAPCG